MEERIGLRANPWRNTVDELTADRLLAQDYRVPFDVRLGHHPDNRIDRIDLLKIDAEKSELDIIEASKITTGRKSKQVVLKSTTQPRGGRADRSSADRKGYRWL